MVKVLRNNFVDYEDIETNVIVPSMNPIQDFSAYFLIIRRYLPKCQEKMNYGSKNGQKGFKSS